MSKAHGEDSKVRLDWRKEHCGGQGIVRNKIFQRVVSFAIDIKMLKPIKKIWMQYNKQQGTIIAQFL